MHVWRNLNCLNIYYFVFYLSTCLPILKKKNGNYHIHIRENYKCLVFMLSLRYESAINFTFFLKCFKYNSAT